MSQKVIYVKTPKTASTSLREILRQSFSPVVEIYVETKHWPDRQVLKKAKLIILGEVVAKKFKRRYPEIWHSSFSCAVVRNPYDKTISAWKYCESTKNRQLKDVLRNAMPRNKFWTKDNHDYIHFTLPQSSFLVWKDKLIVDTIFRFENLIAGKSRIYEYLGLTANKLPHRNQNRQRPDDNKDCLTADIINLINKRYRDDFDFFDYEKKNGVWCVALH